MTAHELSETITDPSGTAWYDRSGAEIGDKCAWIFNGAVTLDNGSEWQLQEEWSHAVTGCVQGNGQGHQDSMNGRRDVGSARRVSGPPRSVLCPTGSARAT